MSKPLDPATVPDAFYLSQNGVLVEGALSVSGGGTAIHFNPAANLAPGALVQVFVTSDGRGHLRQRAVRLQRIVHRRRRPDRRARRRSSAAARSFYSSGNPTNAVIDVEFSEPLSPATVTSANLYVVNAAGQPLAGTLSLRNGGRIVRFTPAAPFAANNYNYVYLTNGLRDLQNTPFAGTNFYFYTGPDGGRRRRRRSRSRRPTGGCHEYRHQRDGAGVPQRGRQPADCHRQHAVALVERRHRSRPASRSTPTNTIVTLVPQAPLPASTLMTREPSTASRTRSGNAVAPQTAQFTTGTSADTGAADRHRDQRHRLRRRPTCRPTPCSRSRSTSRWTSPPCCRRPRRSSTTTARRLRSRHRLDERDGLTYTFVPDGAAGRQPPAQHQHVVWIRPGGKPAGRVQPRSSPRPSPATRRRRPSRR